MVKKILFLTLMAIGSQISSAQNILMFVSHEDTYYSEYIVMKEALEASGYTLDVRSVSTMDFSIYMDPYSDIQDAADQLSGSSYSEFESQFLALFGSEWDGATHNAIPNFATVDGSILDVTDFSSYDGLIIVGGTGALDYRVDGIYGSQGVGERLISAEDVQASAEKLNELALEALLDGKPVMAQCHGASIPAFWRIPGTSGTGEEALGFSLLKGGVSTGYPDDETPIMLESLDITPQPNDRVTISSPHSSFEDENAGEGRIITTRDWYPQTVAYAARTFLNILETYPNVEERTGETTVLVLHGGALDDSNMPSSCSGGNKNNDVPCNNGTEDENLPADYRHLMTLLEGAGAGDDFVITPSELDLSGTLPFDINNENQILAELEQYDVVVFFKHWSTFISDELQNAIVTYADNGGGVLALHHGLYNDIDNGQNKNILAEELFGAHSIQSEWSATLKDYTVHSTNYGHFISSYLIDYSNSEVDPDAWVENPLPSGANTPYSTTHTFSIYDELYNNMAFTGTVDFGREIGEITPLFSNDQRTAQIAHTTGFTRTVDFNEDEVLGKVVYFEIGERKENYTVESRFGQLVRNSVIWAAPDREVLELLEQTISFEPGTTEYTYGDDSFALEGSASSGLDVTYLSSDEGVISITGLTASIVGAGTVSITASQGGDEEYHPAEDVVVEFTVSNAELEITADNQNKIYGENNPTLSMSFDGFVNGEDQSVLTLPTISTDALTGSDVVEGGYAIILSGGEAENYNITLVDGILTILKAEQTVEIESIPNKVSTDPNFLVTATSTSGGDLIFGVTGPATNVDNEISLTGQSGIVEITVTQIGTINYNSASESVSITVSDPAKLDQTINFTEVDDKVYGNVFTLTGSSSSELPLSFSIVDGPLTISGNEITVVGVGQATVAANQAGNESFNPAEEIQRSFNILKADQILTVEEISDKTTLDEPFMINATVNTGFDLTFDLKGVATINETTISLTGEPGEVDILVSQEGTEFYNYISQVVKFDVLEVILSSNDFEDINIYPNPTSFHLNIELPESATVVLLDLSGRALNQQQFSKGSLDISQLKNGLYIIEIRFEDRVVRGQIIKIN